MNQQSVVLASGNIARIVRCEHGVVHMHIGAFSVRLHDEAFMQFASGVEAASSRLMDMNLEKLFQAHESEAGE